MPVEEVAPVRTIASRREGVTASAALRTIGLYCAAGASYVGLAIFFTQLMLSWVLGFAWLELWVWIIPTLLQRWRR